MGYAKKNPSYGRCYTKKKQMGSNSKPRQIGYDARYDWTVNSFKI